MYAIVEYNDYRKEQNFEVITTTDDVEYAKKVAFHYAKKKMSGNETNKDSICKISTQIENEYLQPNNQIIISYRLIDVKKNDNGNGNSFRILCTYSKVFAVIKLKQIEKVEEEIDLNLIYNDNEGDESESDKSDNSDNNYDDSSNN